MDEPKWTAERRQRARAVGGVSTRDQRSDIQTRLRRPSPRCQLAPEMPTALDAAWATGSATSLGAAIGSMSDPEDSARALLALAVARMDAPGIYGPQFRLK
jgi:hypothetical protein